MWLECQVVGVREEGGVERAEEGEEKERRWRGRAAGQSCASLE